MYCLRKYLSKKKESIFLITHFLFCGEYEDKEFTKQTPYKVKGIEYQHSNLFDQIFPTKFHVLDPVLS